jgi:hypothetical protein
VTPSVFRARLAALDLTIEGFARLTGVNPATARCWGKARSGRGIQAFPTWVELLLAAWTAHPVDLPRDF